MITNVKARYSRGVLTPLQPLNLEEGKEVMVSIEDTPVRAESEPILHVLDRLRKSVQPEVWNNLPGDGAKNYKHYLYGRPKEMD